MRHRLKLTVREKIDFWLDLCDFIFNLMKAYLPKRELEKSLKRNRQTHLENDYLILSKLAKLK